MRGWMVASYSAECEQRGNFPLLLPVWGEAWGRIRFHNSEVGLKRLAPPGSCYAKHCGQLHLSAQS